MKGVPVLNCDYLHPFFKMSYRFTTFMNLSLLKLATEKWNLGVRIMKFYSSFWSLHAAEI